MKLKIISRCCPFGSVCFFTSSNLFMIKLWAPLKCKTWNCIRLWLSSAFFLSSAPPQSPNFHKIKSFACHHLRAICSRCLAFGSVFVGLLWSKVSLYFCSKISRSVVQILPGKFVIAARPSQKNLINFSGHFLSAVEPTEEKLIKLWKTNSACRLVAPRPVLWETNKKSRAPGQTHFSDWEEWFSTNIRAA